MSLADRLVADAPLLRELGFGTSLPEQSLEESPMAVRQASKSQPEPVVNARFVGAPTSPESISRAASIPRTPIPIIRMCHSGRARSRKTQIILKRFVPKRHDP
jgi:hypothetical protein